MDQYVAPSPISFVANNGPPMLIIYRSEPLPAVLDIIFTILEENQTNIAFEFMFGIHHARPDPDNRFVFAQDFAQTGGPRRNHNFYIRFAVEVFQRSERGNADVQIPYPSEGPLMMWFSHNMMSLCIIL